MPGSIDVLGMELSQAAVLLDKSGVSYKIIEAAPFFKGNPIPLSEGAVRIIRQQKTDSGLVLTCCRIPKDNIYGQ